jgi:protein tyrosine phosphatase
VPGTIDDFFRLLFAYRVRVVVMLTDWQEGGIVKAANYLPTPDYQVFSVCTGTPDELIVTLKSEEVLGKPDGQGALSDMTRGCYIHRIFTLQPSDQSSPPMVIDHYQYLGWADYGVGDTDLVLQLIDDVDKIVDDALVPEGPEPLQVVHCSAGVGRTGVWIVLRTMLHQLKSAQQQGVAPFLDVGVMIDNIRTQRNGMELFFVLSGFFC